MDDRDDAHVVLGHHENDDVRKPRQERPTSSIVEAVRRKRSRGSGDAGEYLVHGVEKVRPEPISLVLIPGRCCE
jgi:hypothetical protein